MNRIHLPVAPVAHEERLAVFTRERSPVTKRHARGGAGTYIINSRQAIRIIRGPFAGAVSPAELTAARHQADARRPIPRRVHVPFHVGIVSEKTPLAVEGGVERIAK